MTRKSRLNYLKAISHNVERKKMYKAKKQWIVAGMSFLVATGLGALGNHLDTHADTTATKPLDSKVIKSSNNSSNNQKNKQINQSNQNIQKPISTASAKSTQANSSGSTNTDPITSQARQNVKSMFANAAKHNLSNNDKSSTNNSAVSGSSSNSVFKGQKSSITSSVSSSSTTDLASSQTNNIVSEVAISNNTNYHKPPMLLGMSHRMLGDNSHKELVLPVSDAKVGNQYNINYIYSDSHGNYIGTAPTTWKIEKVESTQSYGQMISGFPSINGYEPTGLAIFVMQSMHDPSGNWPNYTEHVPVSYVGHETINCMYNGQLVKSYTTSDIVPDKGDSVTFSQEDLGLSNYVTPNFQNVTVPISDGTQTINVVPRPEGYVGVNAHINYVNSSDNKTISTQTINVSGNASNMDDDLTNDLKIPQGYQRTSDSHVKVSTKGLRDMSGIPGMHAYLSSDGKVLTVTGNMSNYTSGDSDFGLDENANQAFSNVTTLNLGKVTNFTNAKYLFANLPSLTTINQVGDFDTSNVTDMEGMFTGDSSLKNIQPLSNWNVGNVSDMSYMFSWVDSHMGFGPDLMIVARSNQMNLSSSDLSPISNWNMSNVKNIQSMFNTDENLTNVNALSNWNTSSVINSSDLFQNDYNLTNISALSNWDTSNITNMDGLFQSDHNLNNIEPLSNWDTSNVHNMEDMFANDKSLSNIDALSDWNTNSIANGANISKDETNGGLMFDMFNNTPLEDTTPLPNWPICKDTGKNDLYGGTPNAPSNPPDDSDSYIENSGDGTDYVHQDGSNHTQAIFNYIYNGISMGSGQRTGLDGQTIKVGTFPENIPTGYTTVNPSQQVTYGSSNNVAIKPVTYNHIKENNLLGSNVTFNIPVKAGKVTDTVDYVYLDHYKIISSNYHPTGSDGKQNTNINWNNNSAVQMPANWHLADDGSQNFTYNGGTHYVNIIPNMATDTIQYQYNGNTQATAQFSGGDSRAQGASDSAFVIGKDPTNLPNGYHVVNPNQTIQYDGGTHQVAIAPNVVSDTIDYVDPTNNSLVSSNFQPSGNPGSTTSINWTDYNYNKMPGGWNVDFNKNSNPQFTYDKGTHTVYIEPNWVTDNVNYVYNGQIKKTAQYNGNNANVMHSGYTTFDASNNIPAGFHATTNTQFNNSDTTHTVQITPNIDNDYIDYYFNGNYIGTSPDIQGNDYNSGINGTFTITSSYAPGLSSDYHVVNGDGIGNNQLTFNHMNSHHRVNVDGNTVTDTVNYVYKNHPISSSFHPQGQYGHSNTINWTNYSYNQMPANWNIANDGTQNFTFDNGSHDVNIVPNQATDTITYSYHGAQNNYSSSKQFKGNYVGANGASDTSFNAGVPSGYQLAPNTTDTFNYDGQPHTVNIEPTSISTTIDYISTSGEAGEGSLPLSGSYGTTSYIASNAFDTSGAANLAPRFHVISNSAWTYNSQTPANEYISVSSNVNYESMQSANNSSNNAATSYSSLLNSIFNTDAHSESTQASLENNSANDDYSSASVTNQNTKDSNDYNEISNDVVSASNDESSLSSYYSELNSAASTNDQNAISAAETGINNEYNNINALSTSALNTEKNMTDVNNSSDVIPQSVWSSITAATRSIADAVKTDSSSANSEDSVESSYSSNDSGADDIPSISSEDSNDNKQSNSIETNLSDAKSVSNSVDASVNVKQQYSADSKAVSSAQSLVTNASNGLKSMSEYGPTYNLAKSSNDIYNDSILTSKESMNEHNSLSSAATSISASANTNLNSNGTLVPINGSAETSQSTQASSSSQAISKDSSVMSSASSVINSASSALSSNSNDIVKNTNNRSASVSYASAINESNDASSAQSAANSASSEANSIKSEMIQSQNSWIAPITKSSADKKISSDDNIVASADNDSTKANLDSSQATVDSSSAYDDLAESSNNSNYDYSALVSLSTLDSNLSGDISADSLSASKDASSAQSYATDVSNDYYSGDNAAGASADSNSTVSEDNLASSVSADAYVSLAVMSSVASQMNDDIDLNNDSKEASNANLATNSESSATDRSINSAIQYSNSASTENNSASNSSINSTISNQVASQDNYDELITKQIASENALIQSQTSAETSLNSEHLSVVTKSKGDTQNVSLSALTSTIASEMQSYAYANTSLNNKINSENQMLKNHSNEQTSVAAQKSATQSDITNQNNKDSALASRISTDSSIAQSASTMASAQSASIYNSYATSMSKNAQSITNNAKSMSSIDSEADNDAYLASSAEVVASSEQQDADDTLAQMTSTDFNELLSATTQASYATSMTSMDYSNASSIKYIADSYAKSENADLNGNDIQYQDSIDDEFYNSLSSYSSLANKFSTLASSASSQATNDTENIGKNGITESNINTDESNASNDAYLAESNMNNANGAYDLITDKTVPSTKQTVINSDIAHIHADSSSADNFNGQSDKYISGIISGDDKAMSTASSEATQDSYIINMNDANKQRSIADSAYTNASAENMVAYDMASDNIPKVEGVATLHLIYNIHQNNNQGKIMATRTKTIYIPFNKKLSDSALTINPWNYTKPYYDQTNQNVTINFNKSDFTDFKKHDPQASFTNLSYNPAYTFTYNVTQAGDVIIRYNDSSDSTFQSYSKDIGNFDGLAGQSIALSNSQFGGDSDNIFNKLDIPAGYHLVNQLNRITLQKPSQTIVMPSDLINTFGNKYNVKPGMILMADLAKDNSTNNDTNTNASTTLVASTTSQISASNQINDQVVPTMPTNSSIPDTNTPQSNTNLANVVNNQGNSKLQAIVKQANDKLSHMAVHHNPERTIAKKSNNAIYAKIHHAKVPVTKLPRVFTLHQLNKVGRNHTVRFGKLIVTSLSGKHSYKFRILKHVYLHKKIYFTHGKVHSLKPSHKALRINRIFLVHQGKHTYIRLELRFNHHTYFITGHNHYVQRLYEHL